MKVNKSYLFLLFILFLIVIGICVTYTPQRNGESAERDYPEIEKDGILRFVTEYNSIGYFVSGDSISGFNYDLIHLLQEYTPIKLEIQLEANLAQSIDGIRTGKYDVLVRNIPITSALRDSLAFTDPVLQSKQVLIQRKKEYNNDIVPIRSHLDLAKKTIYIPEKSPAILRINNLSREIGDTIYYIEDSLYGSEQLIMKVASNEIDYTVSDEKTAKSMAASLPEIDYNTLIGFTHFEAWAVRKNAPALLDSLNKWLDMAKQTDKYKNLYRKYYQ